MKKKIKKNFILFSKFAPPWQLVCPPPRLIYCYAPGSRVHEVEGIKRICNTQTVKLRAEPQQKSRLISVECCKEFQNDKHKNKHNIG